MNVNLDAPDQGAGTGGNRPEGKTITMAMIAKAAGVSQGAISSLLNDRDYGIRVSPKTRERVFRVCREMGYMPNDLRAVVRMYPELGEFALLIANDLGLEDPISNRLATTLLAQTPAHHLSIASYDPQFDYALHPEALPQPVASGVASRFLTFGAPNTSLFSAILGREFAGVHLGVEAGVPGYTSIVPEYARVSRLAIETLLRLGHSHIAILAGPFGSTDPITVEMNYGIRAAYDAARIPVEARNVIHGDPGFEHGVSSVDLLMDRTEKPTGIFCFHPLTAAGVMHRAQERGLRIPEDLSVIAYGETSFGPLLHPSLTTVSIPAGEVVAKALGDLATRIQTQDLTATRRIVITPVLNENGSCRESHKS